MTMENVKLLFCGTQESQTSETKLELFATNDNDIIIIMEGDGIQLMNISKETAIRLCKELKKQIALLD
jgi:hypothetical protein